MPSPSASPSSTAASPSKPTTNEDLIDSEHRSKRTKVEAESDDGEIDESPRSTEDSPSTRREGEDTTTQEPPLPSEAPPLPVEAPPGRQQDEEDDGWAPVWEQSAQAYYFYNRFTGASQWHNPRVPEVPEPAPTVIPPAPGTNSAAIKPTSISLTSPPPPTSEPLPAGGYNPAIHGDYDPNAWYAQAGATSETQPTNPSAAVDPTAQYAASAAFNRFTGRFQNSEITPENYNDENKSKRQMNAFFDVDAAANNHEGKSLKAERSGKKLTKTELKNFKEKRKAKKEEKRRAWLKD